MKRSVTRFWTCIGTTCLLVAISFCTAVPAFGQGTDAVASPVADAVASPVEGIQGNAEPSHRFGKTSESKSVFTINLIYDDNGDVIVDDAFLAIAGVDSEVGIDATGRLYDLKTSKWLRSSDPRYLKVVQLQKQLARKTAPPNLPASRKKDPAIDSQYPPPALQPFAPTFTAPGYLLPASPYTLQPSKSHPYLPQESLVIEFKAMQAKLEAQTELLKTTLQEVETLKQLLTDRATDSKKTKQKKRK